MATESKLQSKIMAHLEANGWEVVRPIILSKAGYEDLFCFKNGTAMFIEVKADEKEPRALQAYRINQHRKNGFKSFFCNSWEIYLDELHK
jgi:Holliday junction resolvase-like predicted endonuclease